MRHYHVTQQVEDEQATLVGMRHSQEEAVALLIATVTLAVADHKGMRLESVSEGTTISVVTTYSSWSGARLRFSQWACESTTCERSER